MRCAQLCAFLGVKTHVVWREVREIKEDREFREREGKNDKDLRECEGKRKRKKTLGSARKFLVRVVW